jgi:hypothetical protein
MKHILRSGLLILIFLTFVQADLTRTFIYEKSEIRLVKKGDYLQAHYGKMEMTTRPGLPQLPFEIRQVNAPIDTIIILSKKHVTLKNGFPIYPAQKPQALSVKALSPFQPLDKMSTSGIFPKEPVEQLPPGKMGSENLSSYRIFPLQYDHNKQELKLLQELVIEIKTHTVGDNAFAPSPVRQKIISRLTETPTASASPSTNNKYIIITSAKFAPSFLPLQHWKYKKGLAAEIITTEFITENYNGPDLQSQIRNCIKDYYENQGAQWILLGGDTEIIPDRKAWAFDCEYGHRTDENHIPCDLYYSDMDGTWDDDGDGIYGETEDNIDIYPDVFVGRAPVESIADVETFVDKILTYEKAVSDDYQNNMLFLAQILWKDPVTDSGDSKNYIDENFVPARFDPITKLYESSGNADQRTAKSILNAGTHIINHDGHAWYSIMSLGNGSLYNSDMLSLTNKNRYSVLYSIGCWPAAIDYDAIAEDFITNPNGGGVAFIGNSRYGWGSPGNPLFGYSDRFDQQFFRQLFVNKIHNIGATLAAVKAYYAPLSKTENVYRWCQYEINLLGDPEMMIFTDLPKSLTVTYPKMLHQGKQQFSVSVKDENGPVENCTLCLYQDNGFYFVGLTNEAGIVHIDGTLSGNSDEISLTATAHNHKPYESTIPVTSDKAFLSISRVSHNSLFDQNMKLMEDIKLFTNLKNSGSEKAENIGITISCNHPKITLIDSTFTIDELLPQDSLNCNFIFQIKEPFYNEEIFNFSAKINYNSNHTEKQDFAIKGNLPNLVIKDVLSAPKNLLSNEALQCRLVIENQGEEHCEEFEICFDENEQFSVIAMAQNSGGLAPEECDTLSATFQIGGDADSINYIEAGMTFRTLSDFTMRSQLILNVGNFGLSEDFESQSDFWTTTVNDQWHRSAQRKNSGNYAYYCGDEATGKYNFSQTKNLLESDYFYPGKNGKLSFYCWYEFPNYGTTGMRVEVLSQGEWKVLDFIGSGGALNILPTGNDWIKYEYDLSFLHDFEPVKIRFNMKIDTEEIPTEGIYIDDIQVTDEAISFSTIDNAGNQLPQEFQLYQNYPNPFNPETNIKFSLPSVSRVKLAIYNLRGELVEELTHQNYAAGNYILKWNAKNFSSGFYFYKLETENHIAIRKCLYIK